MDQLQTTKNLNSIGISLLYLVAILLLVILVRVILKNRFVFTSEEKMICNLKMSFYTKVSTVPLIELEKSDYYDTYSKSLMVTVSKYKKVFNEVLRLVSSFSVILSLLMFIFVLDYIIIIMSIFIMIIILMSSNISGKIEYDYYNTNLTHTRYQKYLDEVFYNKRYADELRIYNSSRLFIKRYFQTSNSKIGNMVKFSLKRIIFGFLKLFSNSAHSLVIIFYLSYKVIADGMALGSFTSLLVSSQILIQTMKSVLLAYPNLKKELLFFDDYVDINSVINSGKKKNSCGSYKIGSIDSIELQSVYFSYPDCNEYILKDINQKFIKGEKVAFIGLNGSGKTTLSKIITNQFNPSKGSIRYNNVNSNRISNNNIFSKVSLVSQNFNLYNLSISENISMLEKNECDILKVWDCIKAVGLYEKIKSLSCDIDTVFGKMYDSSGVLFSGGEMQRLAIARALYKDSEIIIFDESSSSLDPIIEEEINKVLLEVSSEKILILITHRLSLMNDMDKILVMRNGSIIESGTHSKLLLNKKDYYTIYNSQLITIENKKTIKSIKSI